MFFCFKPKIKYIFVGIILFTVVIFWAAFFKSSIKTTSAISEDKGIFVPIIMYHSFLKDVDRCGKFIVTPDTLENDLKFLAENGYNSILIKDLVSYASGNTELPDNPVIITFDDGHYNNVTYAIPILEKYNMKAVISVVGSFTDKFSQQDGHNPGYSHLTWQDIHDLNSVDRIEIGNHTYNLHKIGGRKGCGKIYNESIAEYRHVLTDDIYQLQDKLVENGCDSPITFTYPYGFISEESVQILKEMGFSATLTCYEKPNYVKRDPADLFGLNRYNRPSGISTEEFMKKVLKQ